MNFGSGMHHDVRSVFQGAEQEGRGERAVHNERDAVGVRHFRQRFHIHDVAVRVAQAFHVQGLGIVPDGPGKILNVPRVHKRGFYAGVRQRIGKEIVRSAIYGGGRNDVVPGPGDVLDGIRDCGGPGGDGQRGRPSFQGGDALFKNICGRVHQAVINIARLRQGKTGRRLFRVFEDIGSGGVNRHGARIGGRVRTFLTHVDLACFKSMVSLLMFLYSYRKTRK